MQEDKTQATHMDGQFIEDGESLSLDQAHSTTTSNQVEKKLVRLLDYRLMIWAFWGYFANGLDRNNMPNAQTTGLSEDLNLVGNQYNWALTMFFIGYIV
jgi:sugar phosphate permease